MPVESVPDSNNIPPPITEINPSAGMISVPPENNTFSPASYPLPTVSTNTSLIPPPFSVPTLTEPNPFPFEESTT